MLDIENIVYSRIVAQIPSTLTTSFPNLNFTNSDRQATNPKFPSAYIHMMGSTEIGNTLNGVDINGVLASFQIEVTDNTSQSNCKKVMDEIVHIMKSMHFEVVSMPEFRNTSAVYRTVARFRREIMALDIL